MRPYPGHGKSKGNFRLHLSHEISNVLMKLTTVYSSCPICISFSGTAGNLNKMKKHNMKLTEWKAIIVRVTLTYDAHD